ncbi:MAG: hypothetical protein CMG71_01590 [Candidatus Marinimicrobia bacterium]|nr:hypothetical protein [Candidatus Neomarinimicrobiota bacterium]|tara:strand:- start:1546 stop:2382 length:837 start_codon:yes stop_codon:yes gene_type:complete
MMAISKKLLPLLGVIVLFEGCAPAVNPWDRFESAQSISVYSVKVDNELTHYKEVWTGRGKSKTVSYEKVVANPDEVNFGLSELGTFAKGIKSTVENKNLGAVVGAGKGLMDDKANAIASNESNLSHFSDNFSDYVSYAVKDGGFDPKVADGVSRWIDVKGNKVGKLVEKTNSDALITVQGHAGYVKVSTKVKGLGGLVKIDVGATTGDATYTFVGVFWLKVADKEGVIGSQKMWIDTGIKKKSDKGYPPVFTKGDYDVLVEKLQNQLSSFLSEKKLMG